MSRARDFADLAGSADAGGLTGKNMVVNGAMTVAQRSASVTGITGTGYNTVDRWKTELGGLGTWTQSQSTDVPSGQGFAYSLKMDCTTADASPAADDYLYITTILEGQDLQHLKKGTSSAESVTLSFWVKSSKTGTHIAEIYDLDNFRHISRAYTVNAANTWEHKSLTFPGDTVGAFGNDNGASLVLNMFLGAGSNRTSGTLATAWQANDINDRGVGQVNLADSTSNEWYITGVQLEAGQKATAFEHRSYADELHLCKRYYRQWAAADSTNNYIRIGLGPGQDANNALVQIFLDPEMRVKPSQTVTGQMQGYNGSNLSNCTTSIDTATSHYFVMVQLNGMSGMATGQAVELITANTSTNKYALSAEL